MLALASLAREAPAARRATSACRSRRSGTVSTAPTKPPFLSRSPSSRLKTTSRPPTSAATVTSVASKFP